MKWTMTRCAEPGWEGDVKLHEGRDFCLCGDGGGVDDSGGSGVLRSGGVGLF